MKPQPPVQDDAVRDAIDADPPEVQARMIALLRQAGPERRLALARSLTMATRSLAWEGLRRRHPERDRRQQAAAFVELVYGRELAERYAAWQAGCR